jgi:Gas vesicle synthesis protein GvpL/GvpF
MILNAAYLIDDQQAASFRQAVDDLRTRLPLQLELTGPWPPYSFADAGPDLQ